MYSSAARTILQSYSANVEGVLELKTNFGGSNTFSEYNYKSATINIRDGVARELSVSLLNADQDFSDETNQAIRTQLKAIARFTVKIGSESEVKFYGRSTAVNPSDYNFSMTFRCLYQDLLETESDPYVEPSSEEVCDASTRRAITNVDASQSRVFGFVDDDTGTDPAFNQGGSAPRRRRSWQRRPIEVWKHASDTDPDYQLTGTKFNVDWTSGVIEILEAEADLLATYYVVDVRAYQESTASGATNCDWARVWQQMITYPAAKRGAGFVLGTDWGNAVTAVNTGSKQITISGNFVDHYPDGCQIYMQENSASDPLTLTVNGTPSYSSGPDTTTITVNESISTMSVADGYISRDVGLDLDRPFGRLMKNSELLAKVTTEALDNLKGWFEPETMKFRYELVEQLPASGTPVVNTNYHYQLLKPKARSQPRDTRDYYSSIVRTGKVSLPVNDVAEAGSDSRVTDITTGGTWFPWDSANVGADSTFAAVIPRMWDGDANKSAQVHNLNTTADVDGVSGNKYKGYYYHSKIDLGSVKNIDRVRIHMPGSRNEKAGAGHQGIFWPGIKLEISDDDGTYYLLSVDAFGRYEPGSVIDIEGDRMQRARGRYIRVLCGAYKHGFDDQSDPSIGVAELEVWTNSDYEVIREISPMHGITGVTTGALGDFTVPLDVRDDIHPGDTIAVRNSPGNDGAYTVGSLLYDSGNDETTIKITGSVPDGTVDGELYSTTDYVYLDGTTVKRDYPELWDRNGGKQKVDRDDFGTKYSEAVGGDVALTIFEESTRLFQEYDYTSLCDPMPRIWKTLYAVDEINGNVLFLCQDIVLRFGSNFNAEFNGVNYQSEVPV